MAVDRRFRRDGEQTADFISCVAFGKAAEFAEKYFHQGIKIAVTGRIQTGSYTNREGNKVYTTDELCIRHDLDPLQFDRQKKKGKTYAERRAELDGRMTGKDIIRYKEKVNALMENSRDMQKRISDQ